MVTNNVEKRILTRVEQKVDFLLSKLGYMEEYEELRINKYNALKAKRLTVANENSKDLKLVEEARRYYKASGKYIPADGLVLFFYNRKPYWLII